MLEKTKSTFLCYPVNTLALYSQKFLLTILLPSAALSKAEERALAFASITQKSPVRDAITPPPQGVGDGGKKKYRNTLHQPVLTS